MLNTKLMNANLKTSNIKKYLCLIIPALLIMSCETNINEQTIWINSAKVDCVGVGPMQCFNVKNSESEDWTNFYQEIKGFNFEPGYIYKLKVSVDTLDRSNLPADKSFLEYKLIEILSKDTDPFLPLNDIWMITQLKGIDNLKDIALKSIPTIELNTKTRSIMGSDGCNRFRGKLETLKEGKISFGPLMGTKKLCAEMTTPNNFNSALSQVKYYKHNGLELLFFDRDNELLIGLKKVD